LNTKPTTAAGIVLATGIKILDIGVDGDYVEKQQWVASTSAVLELKLKALVVFKWIINQTQGFQIPVRVIFRYGQAQIIGQCLCQK